MKRWFGTIKVQVGVSGQQSKAVFQTGGELNQALGHSDAVEKKKGRTCWGENALWAGKKKIPTGRYGPSPGRE